MPVPDVQSLLLPVLKTFADGKGLRYVDTRKRLTESLKLTRDDELEMEPSGRYTKLQHHAYWATQYLLRAELVMLVRPGVFQLTEEGKQLLKDPSPSLSLDSLQNLPAYKQWQNNSKAAVNKDGSSSANAGPDATPEKVAQIALQRLEDELQAEVLARVQESSPSFLEQVIVDLLIAMGYGGGEAARGTVTGRWGDGGIDGVIKEDALGLDEVYVQAKKYAGGNPVGESDVRNFVGAIDVANTAKGVFVTTADFTKSAKAYVERSSKRIILIDGPELARLMVQYGIGVRTRQTFQLKRIDEDYFDTGMV
jgi:restriction system protein